MHTSYTKRLQDQLTRYFYMQLIISIYSYLILVCWGLPFTPLSFLGNLIFNPVLTIFLGLATLLFFSELCYIPNQPIIYLLELLSRGWLFILSLGSTDKCNITCAKPPYLVIAIIGCATFIIMTQQSSYLKKNMLLTLLAAAGLWMMSSAPRVTQLYEIPYAQGKIHTLTTEHELVIIDPGCLGRYASAPDFVEYNLIPILTQRYGTHTIDHLILLQPGQRLFEAINKLLEKATIKHIYLPLWKGDAHGKMLYQYMRMKQAAHEQKCIVHRLKETDAVILKTLGCSLDIAILGKVLSAASITYPAFAVIGSIDKKPFTIYPAKYTRQTLNQC